MAAPKKINDLNIPCEIDGEWRNETKGILGKWRFALENGLYTDLTFLVGKNKEEIKVHKVVLKLQSSEFERVIGDSDLVKLQYNPDTFRLFLQYLYTEDICPTLEQAASLFPIAKRFAIRQLANVCVHTLADGINEEHSPTIFEWAREMGESDLQRAAEDFIGRNARAVYTTKAFTKLSLESLKALLMYPGREIDELSAFQAVLSWANAEIRRKGLETKSENYQYVLQSAADHINFESLSLKDFSEHVVDTGIISDARMVQIFKKLSVQSVRRSAASVHKKYLVDIRLLWSNEITPVQDSLFYATNIRFKASFTINRRVHLLGIALSNVSFNEGYVVLKDYTETVVLGQSENLRFRGSIGPASLTFSSPVRIEATTWVTLLVDAKNVRLKRYDGLKSNDTTLSPSKPIRRTVVCESDVHFDFAPDYCISLEQEQATSTTPKPKNSSWGSISFTL